VSTLAATEATPLGLEVTIGFGAGVVIGAVTGTAEVVGFLGACKKGHLTPLRQYPAKWYLQGTEEFGDVVDEETGATAGVIVGEGDGLLLGETLPFCVRS
jgi:hypothetical protein